jgi:hypothetical protein
MFLALDERGTKPEDSIAFDPYRRIFTPVAVRNAERSAGEAAKAHAVPVVNVIAPIEDLEQGNAQNVLDEMSSMPPGLESMIDARRSTSPTN